VACPDGYHQPTIELILQEPMDMLDKRHASHDERDQFQVDIAKVLSRFDDEAMRKAARKGATVIKEAGVASFPLMMALIGDKEAPTAARAAACWLAGAFGRKRAAPHLLAAMRSGERKLRWEAAIALGKLRAKRALKPLAEMVRSGSPSDLRAASAYVLGHVGDADAVGLLLEVLASGAEDTNVRSHAAEALGYIRSSESCSGLTRALGDKSPEVRFWAAFALGQVGCRRALTYLKTLASSDHSKVAGWWTVGEEASRAIEAIRSGQPKRHRPRGE
jgi:HEAT repeat protein